MAGSRKRILWVDDEIEFLRSHIMFLETRGYSVIPVFSGDDAIQMIHENPGDFDIVLLDEQMPGKDGLTTLEEIKEFNPNLPVVMVTKSEEEKLMEDALGRKIDGYLTKPVNPSQILLACKKILDSKRIISSQVAQKFIREYSDIRVSLASRHGANEWIRLYEKITRWDLELEHHDDEGLRQTHAGQKSDSNAAFASFLAENYAGWIKGEYQPPVFSHNIIDKVIAPLLGEGKKVYFIVLSGMRLDQYLGIEGILKNSFDVKRSYYYSILPTSSPFARSSLFSGKLPVEIHSLYNNIWTSGQEEEIDNAIESRLLYDKMKSLKIDLSDDFSWFINMSSLTSNSDILKHLHQCRKNQLVTVVMNFFDSVTKADPIRGIFHEMINNESGIRILSQSWFQRSGLLQLMKEISKQDCTIIFTSDHGHTFCSRGTELYGTDKLSGNIRYVFGKEISSDERRSVFLEDPSHFGLPRFSDETSCVIAKENYYFIHPEKFEFYNKQYRNTFQHGGISLEEVVMPIAICKPIKGV